MNRDRSLHGNAETLPAFELQQRCGRAKSVVNLIVIDGFHENEVRSRSQNRTDLRTVLQEGDGDRRIAIRARKRAAGFEQMSGGFGIVKIYDDLVEAMLRQSLRGHVGRIRAVYGNPELRQDLNQRLCGRLILRYQ